MIQKVLKVGTSAAVTIPKKALEELGLAIGDQISVNIDKQQQSVIIKPEIQVDRELMDWTNSFIDTYRRLGDEPFKEALYDAA